MSVCVCPCEQQMDISHPLRSAHKSLWCGCVTLSRAPLWLKLEVSYRLDTVLGVFPSSSFCFFSIFWRTLSINPSMMTENNEMESGESQLQRSPSTMSIQPMTSKASTLILKRCPLNSPHSPRFAFHVIPPRVPLKTKTTVETLQSGFPSHTYKISCGVE